MSNYLLFYNNNENYNYYYYYNNCNYNYNCNLSYRIFQIFYNILISVGPILALSWLSEKELAKEGF
jgi:hypothetical protein